MFFIVNYANSQTVVSDCSAPDSIIELYKDDAATLALRRIYDNNFTYQDSLIVPQEHMDTVLNALLAVHNAIVLPARDTVVNLNIHSRKNISINAYEIKADTNLPWMQNLLNWNISSGHSQLDLFNGYRQFYISSIFNLTWTNDAWIRFMAPYNYYNIVQLVEPVYYFPGLLGVNTSAPQAYGDGPDITHEVFIDHVQLNYFYKWGDCAAGCTAHRKWTFNVYYDCTVEYVGSSGDELLPSAEVNPVQLTQLEVSPNPTTGIIVLTGMGEGTYSYTITNLQGQLVEHELNTLEKVINISHLTSGQYILSVGNDKEISRSRIIKL